MANVLTVGSKVRLLVDAPGSVPNHNPNVANTNTLHPGTPPPARKNQPLAKQTVVTLAANPVPTLRTQECATAPGPSYSLTANVGSYIEYTVVPVTSSRRTSEGIDKVLHENLSLKPKDPGSVIMHRLYSPTDCLFLLKAVQCTHPVTKEKFMLQAGQSVKITSKAFTGSGQTKQTISSSVKAYYRFQPTDMTPRPIIWKSDLYYSVESKTFERVTG